MKLINSIKPVPRSPQEKAFAFGEDKKLPKIPSKLEEDEDAYIAHLESKLGLGMSGKKKKNSDDDGLDGILFSSITIPSKWLNPSPQTC